MDIVGFTVAGLAIALAITSMIFSHRASVIAKESARKAHEAINEACRASRDANSAAQLYCEMILLEKETATELRGRSLNDLEMRKSSKNH